MNTAVSDPEIAEDSQARRTDPKSFILRGVKTLRQLLIPLAVAAFTIFEDMSFDELALFLVPGLAAVLGLVVLLNYLPWRRLTYTVAEQDIRVESGVLSRAARSVPYERIQDVSLEQSLLPRLLGLVLVKFETGSGGGDDLRLAYLSEAEGERLRQLVRERRAGQSASQEQAEGAKRQDASEPEAHTLFAMNARRLFIFGTFEFSLAVIAVLGGVIQYLDNLVPEEMWEPSYWQSSLNEYGMGIATMGAFAQTLSALFGVIFVLLIGSATGLIRTFLRDWGFLLERTERGFRRRRGLLTKTDVMMPVHRVQGITIGTGWLRRRFGWHGLKFISLAQDAGASNHVVAPFAQLGEIAPIVSEASLFMPPEDTRWHRPSPQHRNTYMAIGLAVMAMVVVAATIATSMISSEKLDHAQWLVLIPIVSAGALVARLYYRWRFARHAWDGQQVYVRTGWLAPKTVIVTREKLHSVEIVQGPIGKRRGYATLHLGLAGGRFNIDGIELEHAKQLREAVMTTITKTDFSKLERG
ncbi:MAG: PH domain-containing protein [Erythrobacter sp.]